MGQDKGHYLKNDNLQIELKVRILGWSVAYHFSTKYM